MAGPGRLPTIDEVGEHLHFCSEQRILRVSKRLAAGDLVRIASGAYLDADFLRSFDTSWQVIEAVGLARAQSVAHRHPDGVMVGETAALLHGIARVTPAQDVHLWLPGRPGSRSPELPPVALDGNEVVRAAHVRRHHGRKPQQAVGPLGDARVLLRVETLEGLMVSCARPLASLPAFVIACGGLAALSHYDKHSDHVGRVAEESIRAQLLTDIERMKPGARGRARASRIIEVADAGCESVAEAVLLWILRTRGVTGIVTQFRIKCGRRAFFADIGIPEICLVIEFDGKAKYGRQVPEVLDSLSERDQRQKLIEREGFVVVRFEWRELSNPDLVMSEISARVAQSGLSLPTDPRKALKIV